MKLNLEREDIKLILKLIKVGKQEFTPPCLDVNDDIQRIIELEKNMVDILENEGFSSRQEEVDTVHEIMDFKEKFIDNLFWEELIKRMTERDIIKKHNIYFNSTMSQDQRNDFKKTFKEFQDEFYEYGLNRLKIDK